jgi:hypothetical protein
MIISHKHRFIFIKTGKVGGTSLEMALSRFLGPEDIITPVSRPDELERYRRGYRTGQNFQKSLSQLTYREWPRWFKAQAGRIYRSREGRMLAAAQRPRCYWDHMDAAAIRERIGSRIWDHYFKFTVERNPWDKVVSAYFWDPKKRKTDLPFRDFVFSGKPLRSQFDRFSINGIVAVDRILRFDRLYSELSELSEHLGLPEDVGETMATLSAKAGYRPDREIAGYYDAETRAIVEIFFAREIRLLGFLFEDGNA